MTKDDFFKEVEELGLGDPDWLGALVYVMNLLHFHLLCLEELTFFSFLALEGTVDKIAVLNFFQEGETLDSAIFVLEGTRL